MSEVCVILGSFRCWEYKKSLLLVGWLPVGHESKISKTSLLFQSFALPFFAVPTAQNSFCSSNSCCTDVWDRKPCMGSWWYVHGWWLFSCLILPRVALLCREPWIGFSSCKKYTGAVLSSAHVINYKLLWETENRVILTCVLLQPCSLTKIHRISLALPSIHFS